MKQPTKSEIVNAREIVSNKLKGRGIEPKPPEMECWEGAGWHRDEVYLGILVGMHIAESRKKKQPHESAESSGEEDEK